MGKCQRCGTEFKSTDTRTSNFTNLESGQIVERHWHVDCWVLHEAEVKKHRANPNSPQSN